MTTTDIGIRFLVDDDGIAWVVFDRPGDKVNLLTPEILETMNGLLNEWKVDENVRGVVFTSTKPGIFIAGMDVQQIAAREPMTETEEGIYVGVFSLPADMFGGPYTITGRLEHDDAGEAKGETADHRSLRCLRRNCPDSV